MYPYKHGHLDGYGGDVWLPTHYVEIFQLGMVTWGVGMVIYGEGFIVVLLEPLQ